jgi:hypothetical protein
VRVHLRYDRHPADVELVLDEVGQCYHVTQPQDGHQEEAAPDPCLTRSCKQCVVTPVAVVLAVTCWWPSIRGRCTVLACNQWQRQRLCRCGMGWDGMRWVGGSRAAAVLCAQMEVPSSRGDNLQATQGISLAQGECIIAGSQHSVTKVMQVMCNTPCSRVAQPATYTVRCYTPCAWHTFEGQQ